MALRKCPDCGKKVSTKAESCPNCGRPLEVIEEKEPGLFAKVMSWILMAVIAFAFYMCFSNVDTMPEPPHPWIPDSVRVADASQVALVAASMESTWQFNNHGCTIHRAWTMRDPDRTLAYYIAGPIECPDPGWSPPVGLWLAPGAIGDQTMLFAVGAMAEEFSQALTDDDTEHAPSPYEKPGSDFKYYVEELLK